MLAFPMWSGEHTFVLRNLVAKDFKVRYRNMSLGVFWSLLNPIVLMAVFTFVFSKVFRVDTPNYPLFVLCGIVPFNFFALAWSSGTNCIVDNAGLVKRVGVPRELIPVASVLGNCINLVIQIALLLCVILAFGLGVNVHWLWLPLIWSLEIVFVLGLVLGSAAINVYVRDTRYVVESATSVLFFLVPIFYSFSIIPEAYTEIYQYNPVAALVMASRNVLLEGKAPAFSLVSKLVLVSMVSLTFGTLMFRRLKHRFYDYL